MLECLPNLTSRSAAPALSRAPPYRDESLDAKYRDVLSIVCVAYVHARTPVKLTAKPAFLMTDKEIHETPRAESEHTREVALCRDHIHLVKGRK
jgi:hypothetical protein